VRSPDNQSSGISLTAGMPAGRWSCWARAPSLPLILHLSCLFTAPD